jgi:hypothetical protein
MEREKPFTVVCIWDNGHESRDFFGHYSDALRFVKHGISWSQGRIKFARVHDDTGESARLESSDTVSRIQVSRHA